MRETWLQTNRRALLLGMIVPAAAVGCGIAAAVGSWAPPWIRGIGWCVVGVGGLLIAILAWHLSQPRLAFQDGELLVYVRAGGPIRVPLSAVECFFLGSGPTLLAGRTNQDLKTANLVIRLAERATDWSDREVKQALGTWSGGYITLRGTWCEPLDLARVQRLNARLAEVRAVDPTEARTG